MNVQFARASEPVIERGPAMSHGWYRMLARLWDACGFSNDVRIYTDLYVDPLSMNYSGSLVTFAALVGSLIVPLFPAGSDASAYFSVRLPGHYRDGTMLKPYVEWAPVDGTTGNVSWQLDYVTSPIDAAAAAAVTISTTTNAPGVANQRTRTVLDDIDGTDRVKGDGLLCRLTRLGGSDTYAADVALLGFGFKHVRDGHGEIEVHP
jgi:hypothetical protein